MFKLYFNITVKDKNGKVKRKITNRCSRSFTKQFLQYYEAMTMHRMATAEGARTIKNTVNSDITVGQYPHACPSSQYGYSQWALMAGVATSTYGIVVGTGTNAESVSDYALQTQCTEGVGANQFNHGAQSYVTSIVVGSDVFFSTLRTFQNASGNTITVAEIGLYYACYSYGTYTTYYICIVRDKLAATVAVLNGEVMTVQYTFKTTN